MLKYNNNHIVTGHIKQLLSSFNLPNCKVYKTERDEAPLKGVTYLKDNYFQRYVGEDTWENSRIEYNPEKSILNRTKNLKITNNVYDSYTHEYLGNYLRFLRDYYSLDLMPLYNCFSNKICSNLNIKELDFNSADSDYKIFILPIKLNTDYTVAVDCTGKIEFCCGLYDQYLFSYLTSTHQVYTNTFFNQPILYKISSLTLSEAEESKLQNNMEDNLKLFIKIPINNKSSITILEGNYLNYTKENRTVINLEGLYKNSTIDLPLYSALSLLKINNGESYPFADTLISYLVDNVVTSQETISDNIKRIQKIMQINHQKYKYEGIWDDLTKYNIYARLAEKNALAEDSLGYLDKNAEMNFKASTGVSASNVDLYKQK